MSRSQPIFNVPTSVVVLIAIFAIIHFARQLLPVAQDNWFLFAMSFIPARYSGFANEFPGGDVACITSLVTHMFVHSDMMHLMFNSAWFLAFGGAIALRVGSLRFLGFSLLTGILGTLVYALFHQDSFNPVIGASGAISGLMGGILRFLFSAVDTGNFAALRNSPRSVPLMTLQETLTDKRVIIISAIYIVLNLITAYGFGLYAEQGQQVAWEGHVGGFFAGLLTFGFFDNTANTASQKEPYLH